MWTAVLFFAGLANSTPLPFFSPGITIKGALTVSFSDLTLL